jgi:hypothetical protein
LRLQFFQYGNAQKSVAVPDVDFESLVRGSLANIPGRRSSLLHILSGIVTKS